MPTPNPQYLIIPMNNKLQKFKTSLDIYMSTCRYQQMMAEPRYLAAGQQLRGSILLSTDLLGGHLINKG